MTLECRRQHMNHFLILFEPLWLHWCLYYLYTMIAPTANVVFTWILECLSQKVPTTQWHAPTYVPPQPFSHSVRVGAPSVSLRCCATTFLPGQFLTQMSRPTDKGEGKTEEHSRRLERAAETSREDGPWDHRCCDAMEMLVVSTQALHDNFELKMCNITWLMFRDCLSS